MVIMVGNSRIIEAIDVWKTEQWFTYKCAYEIHVKTNSCEDDTIGTYATEKETTDIIKSIGESLKSGLNVVQIPESTFTLRR